MPRRLLALAALLLLPACQVLGVRSGTEEPRFDTLPAEAGLELRRYAPRLAATTIVPGDEAAARNEGFRRLAGYIFGGNQGARRIAMTAPVAQEPLRIAMTAPVASEATPDGWRIAFFLPAAMSREDAPVPNDARVTIEEWPAETVAVRRFAGLADAASVAREMAALLAALERSAWRAEAAPVAWFYDPPWTIPALRRNEVAVRITPRPSVAPTTSSGS